MMTSSTCFYGTKQASNYNNNDQDGSGMIQPDSILNFICKEGLIFGPFLLALQTNQPTSWLHIIHFSVLSPCPYIHVPKLKQVPMSLLYPRQSTNRCYDQCQHFAKHIMFSDDQTGRSSVFRVCSESNC